jgi:hypothetical protein
MCTEVSDEQLTKMIQPLNKASPRTVGSNIHRPRVGVGTGKGLIGDTLV